MKKIVLLFLTVLLALSISGCKKDSKTTAVPRNTIEVLESDLETQMISVAEFLDNATFCVLNYSSTESENPTSLGSGVIYKRIINDNNSYLYYLVTNRHVIEGGEKFKVYSSDGSTTTANVLGVSDLHDIGVLTFTSYKKYNVVPFADIDSVKAGEYCFSMGTPLNISYINTFTKGNVSGVRSEFVQHTADINSGNSGGPLVNLNGELIGINKSKISNSMSNVDVDGMYMAIRCDLVAESIDEIEGKNEAVINPLLGMTVTDIDSISEYNYDTFDDLWTSLEDSFVEYYTLRGFSEEYARQLFNDNYSSKKSEYEDNYIKLHAFNVYLPDNLEDGIIIRDVVSGSVSDAAGLKIGDVIVKIGDVNVTNQTSFSIEYYKYGINDTFTITVIRNNEYKTVNITL